MARKAGKLKEKDDSLPPTYQGEQLPKNKKGLSIRELSFIDKYIETSNGIQSAIYAGYSPNGAHVKANRMLKKDTVKAEIKRRMEKMEKKSIATAQEVMEYFTKVMKGEVLDQFGLEAPLAERTKAAVELAKRTVDLENRLNGKPDAKLEIKLDWGNNDEE